NPGRPMRLLVTPLEARTARTEVGGALSKGLRTVRGLLPGDVTGPGPNWLLGCRRLRHMNSGSRIVLGVRDLHQSRQRFLTARALAERLRQHPEHALVVAGDFFDLAFDPPSKDPAESIEEILGCHASLCEVLSERLARGVPVTLLAGNHDA